MPPLGYPGVDPAYLLNSIHVGVRAALCARPSVGINSLMPPKSDNKQPKSQIRRLPVAVLAGALGLALAITLLAGFGPAYARPLATLHTVTTTADSGPGSLRAALVAAGDGDTVAFTLPISSVIVVASELTVTTAITIDGATATNLTLSGGGATRVFSVTAPLDLRGLTVTAGAATGPGGGLNSTRAVTLTAVTFLLNTALGRGGGLYTDQTLVATAANFLTNTADGGRGGGSYALVSATLVDGLFLNNQTLGVFSGGGLGTSGSAFITGTQFISNTAGDSGGGLRASTEAVLTNVLLRDNYALTEGGGLFVNPGGATISGTQFIANQAGGDGGGAKVLAGVTLVGGAFLSNTTGSNGGAVYAANGLAFSGTVFAENTAVTDGGGLYAIGGAVVGEGGLLRGNTAGDDGGGLTAGAGALLTNTQIISNSAVADGGGLHLEGGGGRLVNLVVARNTAGGSGAGLALAAAQVVVIHLTVVDPAGNPGAAIAVQAGSVVLTNTVLAGHAIGLDLLGGAASEDYTLYAGLTITATAGVVHGAHSRTGSAQFVNAAADDYHLGFGSAATNAGVDAGLTFDYDGQARPYDGAFDIGADERYGPAGVLVFLPLVTR